MSEQRNIVGLGELLWDLLPDGPRLGGAPANFTVMSGRLGARAFIASRIGGDEWGRRALQLLSAMPVETGYIQHDPALPTGTVTIELKDGEPEYNIHEPVAWDRLEYTDSWRELANRADAVCFGALAQRERHSRLAILQFLEATRPHCVRVFDVNLRASFWSTEVLQSSIARATILKLNAGEFPSVMRAVPDCRLPADHPTDEEILSCARSLMDRYPVKLVCVTMGGAGSLLIAPGGHHRHPGVPVVLRDAVGAGDAFTAALTHYYLQGAPLPVLNEAGNRWGSWVASQAGAMPELPPQLAAATAAAIENVRSV